MIRFDEVTDLWSTIKDCQRMLVRIRMRACYSDIPTGASRPGRRCNSILPSRLSCHQNFPTKNRREQVRAGESFACCRSHFKRAVSRTWMKLYRSSRLGTESAAEKWMCSSSLPASGFPWVVREEGVSAKRDADAWKRGGS